MVTSSPRSAAPDRRGFMPGYHDDGLRAARDRDSRNAADHRLAADRLEKLVARRHARGAAASEHDAQRSSSTRSALAACYGGDLGDDGKRDLSRALRADIEPDRGMNAGDVGGGDPSLRKPLDPAWHASSCSPARRHRRRRSEALRSAPDRRSSRRGSAPPPRSRRRGRSPAAPRQANHARS